MKSKQKDEKAQKVTHLALPVTVFFRRNIFRKLLLVDCAADFPSPTCIRTTSDVVKALRTFLSGLAMIMYILGVNMQPSATVTLRLTEKDVVMIL